MCGICGFYSKQNITHEQLTAMNDTILHRGPDDGGVEIYEGKSGFSIGFAHRRLSILDLSDLGHQPMHSADGRLSIVYNGEIYNFQEIRERLKGYPFRSHSDTEVILAAYLEWGEDCVKQFNGMFALAIYDRQEESLFLAKDPIGKKPLYYWLGEEGLVFASELKPIMACPGFAGEIRQELLAGYLTKQHLLAPDTIFTDVYQLEPGTAMVYRPKEIPGRKALGPLTTGEEGTESVEGKEELRKWKYWDVAKRYGSLKGSFAGSFEEAKEELRERLKRAVSLRMIADVPLGTFLSGGYDSSLITALAAECSSKPVQTFSIGFEDPAYNEAVYAKEVADHLGCDHHEMYVSKEDMFSLVEDLPIWYDEPFADSSQIPSMLVAKLARQEVTVALSGDGGDEFFCGYNNYRMLADMQKLDALGAAVYGICHLPGLGQAGLMDRLPGRVQAVAANRRKEYQVQPFDYLKGKKALSLLKKEQKDYRFAGETGYGEKDWQIRRMLLDMDTYLPGDILVKVDRASMKYSLESRCPILDKEVMEFSFCLPHSYKYEKGNKKRILKELAYDYIPEMLLNRPKTGFSVPLDQWLRGPLREQLLDYSSKEFLERQDIFREEATAGFIREYLKTGDKGAGTGENYSRMVWAYFVFQKWYERYMM
ncbi:MAG: asparagine synthase (glutamine-hydrolyzing) [Lachnospiraceae bacterium]|nr:asparagine synthase (glutamine-hydrolyzing) [Lachnospiraceae bacterium]